MAPIWDWNCLELDILATKSYTCIELLILIDSGIYIYSEVQYHYISYVVTLRQAMEIEKQRGNLYKRLSPNNVTFADFVNPWNLYTVFFQDKTTVHQWMFARGLLRDNVRCHHCDVSCSLQKREKKNRWLCVEMHTEPKSWDWPEKVIVLWKKPLSICRFNAVHEMFCRWRVSTPHVHQHGYGLQKSVCRLGKFLRELAVEYLYRDVLGRGHNPPMKLRGDV